MNNQRAGARAERQKTKNSVKRITRDLYLVDYQNEYYLDELLETGVSSIAGLVAFAAQKFNLGTKTLAPGDEQGAGCTTFESFTETGDHILARNFDFRRASCFVVWTHPKNGYASMGVVDNNFMLYGQKRLPVGKRNVNRVLLAPYCCVDGINEQGLAIAVLQIKAAATKQTDKSKKDITTTAMIRGVLDTCKDTDEAVAFIKRYNMHDSLYTNYHYQIIDRRGKSVVVEYINNVMHVYQRGSEQYPVTGSVYENDGLKSQYVSNFCITSHTPGFKAIEHGRDRIGAVTKVLREKGEVLSEMDAMTLLSHVRLNYQHDRYPWRVLALWSAVYNVTAGTLKIAAHLDYSKVFTFCIDRPQEILKTEAVENSPYEPVEWQH